MLSKRTPPPPSAHDGNKCPSAIATPQGTIKALARAFTLYRSNRFHKLNKPRWLRASTTGNLEFIKRRLREGQDVEAADDYGRTALWMAARFGHTTIVAQLLAAGAKPNVWDCGLDGNTPLHVATWQGHAEVVRRLLKALADPNLCNWSGHTPLDLVEVCVVQSELNRDNLRHELRRHGGQPGPGAKPSGPAAPKGPPTASPGNSTGSSSMATPRPSQRDDGDDDTAGFKARWSSRPGLVYGERRRRDSDSS